MSTTRPSPVPSSRSPSAVIPAAGIEAVGERKPGTGDGLVILVGAEETGAPAPAASADEAP